MSHLSVPCRDLAESKIFYAEVIEMYCTKLKEAANFARGAKQGGNYTVDFAGLNYEWKG